MKIVLITGSCGLVGAESVDFFHKKGFKIIGVDNNLRKYFFGKQGSTLWLKKRLLKNHKNYKHFNIDIRSYSKLRNIYSKYKKQIKLIIHAAAQPSHDWAVKEPHTDFNINALSTLNLLELTKIYCPNSPFIYLSTNKVYGDNPNKLPLKEKKLRYVVDKKNKFSKGINERMSLDNCVHSLFGVSKLSADLMVQEYGKNLGLKTVSFRAGCITGSKHSGAKLHGFLSFLIKEIENKKNYKIIGHKGKQVRDNIHSKDLVKCFWEFYKKPKYGEVYNIGGGAKCSCSILECIKILEKINKTKIKIEYTNQNRIGDHIWWVTDNSKFIKHYPNFKISYNIKKIIQEIRINNR